MCNSHCNSLYHRVQRSYPQYTLWRCRAAIVFVHTHISHFTHFITGSTGIHCIAHHGNTEQPFYHICKTHFTRFTTGSVGTAVHTLEVPCNQFIDVYICIMRTHICSLYSSFLLQGARRRAVLHTLGVPCNHHIDVYLCIHTYLLHFTTGSTGPSCSAHSAGTVQRFY